MFYEYANITSTILVLIVYITFNFILKKNKNVLFNSMMSTKTPFAPSNWIFSLWILIYIFQLIFNIYSLMYINHITRNLNIFPILINIANIIWIITAFYDNVFIQTMSLIFMLSFLIETYILLGINYTLSTNWILMTVYYAPFSMYLAWIFNITILSLLSILGFLMLIFI